MKKIFYKNCMKNNNRIKNHEKIFLNENFFFNKYGFNFLKILILMFFLGLLNLFFLKIF
jgi:hypothetical protein